MKATWSFLLLFITTSLLHAQPATEATVAPIRLTDSVIYTEVKDQSQSPTCWVFGSNSLFESDLLKKQDIRLNLSEMFIARYAYIDKAITWLATKGKTYYEGGGQFHDVIRVINKYGIVPEDVYDGRPNGESFHNHAKLDTAMKKFANELLTKGETAFSPAEMQQLNDTLDRYLGSVPDLFWFNGKQYSPKTFASEIALSGDDYIEVMAFGDLPCNKRCLLADKFNWAGDSLYNITLEDMEMIADSALAKGWSVGWEGDVTEPGFDYWSGYATISDSMHQFTEERLKDFKNETTERDHMLHLVGIGRDKQGKKWYYLKNSWGTLFSRYRGFIFMEENYFKLKTVTMMVNKQALPNSMAEKLGLKKTGNKY